MRREELEELHYIAPISNVASIVTSGILSHRRAERVKHHSVAMPEIQARRARAKVPGGRLLHEYVNLYICARNPMMYLRKDDHEALCVLRISTAVLDLSKVVISDRNASVDFPRFSPAPDGLVIIDQTRVFAQYWTHDDPVEYQDHKAVKCAEVLVPDRIDAMYIFGGYASCANGLAALARVAPSLPMSLNAHLFFR